MMKILVICQRGNVRSVTVATLLKDYAGLNDVIALGVQTSTPETLQYMVEWADLVINAGQTELVDYLDWPSVKAYVYLGIEIDRWQKSMHPELMRIVVEELQRKTELLRHVNPPFYQSLDAYLTVNEMAYNRK